MTVKTKRMIDGITFSQDEKIFLVGLAGLIETECKNHPCCEPCPFWDLQDKTGAYCKSVSKALQYLAENGIGRQEE